jgi:hypothetical protein
MEWRGHEKWSDVSKTEEDVKAYHGMAWFLGPIEFSLRLAIDPEYWD